VRVVGADSFSSSDRAGVDDAVSRVFPLDGSAVRATTVPPFVDVSPPRAGARWTAPPDFCPPPDEPPEAVPLPPPELPPEEWPPDDVEPPPESPQGTARCAERLAVSAHTQSRAAVTPVVFLVLMVGLWALCRFK